MEFFPFYFILVFTIRSVNPISCCHFAFHLVSCPVIDSRVIYPRPCALVPNVATWEACGIICRDRSDCKAFTYVEKVHGCTIHCAMIRMRKHMGFIAGVKGCVKGECEYVLNCLILNKIHRPFQFGLRTSINDVKHD